MAAVTLKQIIQTRQEQVSDNLSDIIDEIAYAYGTNKKVN
jgi:hypothetical protein